MNLSEAINQPGVTIVDVREPSEFNGGHIEGALNIPLGTVPARLEEFKNMSKPLIMYCRSGGRSGQATHYLSMNGVEEVYNGGSLESVYFLTLQIQD
jgi:rhodanese-related sulfurtransferase